MKNLVITIVCIAMSVLMAPTAHAATVAPATIELLGDRGQVVEDSITVINTHTAPQTYFLSTMKFSSSGEAGVPRFIPNEEDQSGFPLWISFPVREIEVPANSKVDVPFSVAVPADAQAGGHYAAITVSEALYDVVATNGAIIDAKTAVLLLLTVNGPELNPSAQILDFVSDLEDKTVSVIGGEVETRIQNQGNVHIAPSVHVVIKDMRGAVIAQKQLNPEGKRLLPGTTREFSGEIRTIKEDASFFEVISFQMQNLTIGRMSAVLSISFDEVVLTKVVAFTVIPWQLILTFICSIIVLLLLYKGLRVLTKRR